MTDKATVELPSPVAGTVVAINGKPGEKRPVGSELVVLEVAGEGNVRAAPQPRPAAQNHAPSAVVPAKAGIQEQAPSPAALDLLPGLGPGITRERR